MTDSANTSREGGTEKEREWLQRKRDGLRKKKKRKGREWEKKGYRDFVKAKERLREKERERGYLCLGLGRDEGGENVCEGGGGKRFVNRLLSSRT